MNRILASSLILIIGASVLAFTVREGPLDAAIHKDQLVVDEVTRNFRIVVPHETIQPTPVVFAFHGIGDSPDSMAAYSRLDRLAARSGFILVYPAAQNSMWATTNIDLSNLDSNPDVRFFDKLLNHLTSVYEIDRGRIYLIGMSNGSTFAQLLATARSNEIAAVVAHSGSRLNDLPERPSKLPIMLVVGANDLECTTMETDAEEYRRRGHAVEFVTVPRLAHAWSPRHNSDMWRFLSRHVRRNGNVAEQSDLAKPTNGAF